VEWKVLWGFLMDDLINASKGKMCMHMA
jgi:hypothetical protein